jgi:hypothetical protein
VSNFKSVPKEIFDGFIAAYPRQLVKDVNGVHEPPLLTYNDFELAPKWPLSVVAKVVLHADSYPNADGSRNANEYFIKEKI